MRACARAASTRVSVLYYSSNIACTRRRRILYCQRNGNWIFSSVRCVCVRVSCISRSLRHGTFCVVYQVLAGRRRRRRHRRSGVKNTKSILHRWSGVQNERTQTQKKHNEHSHYIIEGRLLLLLLRLPRERTA